MTVEPTLRLTLSRTLIVLVLAVAVVPPVLAVVLQGKGAYAAIATDYPGPFVGVVTAATRALADLAALATVGVLSLRLFFERAERRRRDLRVGSTWSRLFVQRASGVWLCTAAVLVLADAADTNGFSFHRLFSGDALWFAFTTGYPGRAWAVTTVAAGTVWLFSSYVTHWVGTALLWWLALVGALAPVVVGQVLVGPNHDLGEDAAVISTLASSVILGALLVLTVMPQEHRPGPESMSRLRRAGYVGLGIVAAGDLVVMWFELSGGSVTSSWTGWLWLARLGCLAGAWWGIARPGARKRGVVLGSAIFAYVVIGATMTRISPPQYFVPTSIQQILLGYDVSAAPSLSRLVLDWRLNLFFAVLSLTAVGLYARGVLLLHRRGDSWPWYRTLAWVLGWATVLLTTSAGLGRYSGVSFAVHMADHMCLAMLAPILIVLGGAVTLALRAVPPAGPDRPPGLYEWIAVTLNSRTARFLYQPLLVFVVYISSYYVLYLSPLFGDLMRYHWAHQLMNLHFLVVGYLYFGLVIGVDPTPRKLPGLGRLGFLMAAMPFHAFFGVIVMTSRTVIAETFYRYLGLAWHPDLAGVQDLAGGIAWAGSEIPLLIVVVVLAIQWATEDRREARRIDRHLDAGLDESFTAYNDMLARLDRHDNPASRHNPRPPADPSVQEATP